MVGGGQAQKVDVGLKSESVYGQGHPKRPSSARILQQGFGDPSEIDGKGSQFLSLDREYRGQQGGYQMDLREGGGQGGEAEVRGVYGPSLGGMGGTGHEQDWAHRGRSAGGVESGYADVAGVRGGMSEASHSEGTEEEEEEEEDDGGDGERVSQNVGEHGNVGGPHAQIGGMGPDEGRQEAAGAGGPFQRSISERERAALKAAAIGNAGAMNSPFGIFHSPSSTLPFLNSFSSPSNSHAQQLGGGHPDATPIQNGGGGMGGVGVGSASGVTYSLSRDGGLSRNAARDGFRENAVVGSLQEQTRIVSAPLHEQLQSSTDAENYYTTLLNTQVPTNNGLKVADSVTDSGGRQAIADPQLTAEPTLRRILSDPLTGTLMEDAMIISCGHSVGNAGLRRVMQTSVCIMCGASVRTEDMAPNFALRLVIQAYKREEEMNGNIGTRSAKRRRDPAQESIGPPEQAATDAARVKGVQFPFVVSDRVMIKGNKRTPERFVGREAVITTQCLNGWYLVRTLDTGESVRLQYRSLQKVEGSWPASAPALAEFAGVNYAAQCVQ